MKAVVIYESMYGNTHLIANAIAEGLRAHGEVTVVPVAEARATVVEDADLVVVGGPTHAHGMSRAATRKGAVDAARKPGSDLVLEAPEVSDDSGLREWFASIGQCSKFAAAFDTRVDPPGGAHRTRLERHCPQAARFGFRPAVEARELPRHEGHSPRTARGGSSPRVGRAAGKRRIGPHRARVGVEIRALAARV